MASLSSARTIRRAGVAGVLVAVLAVLAAARLLYTGQREASDAAQWVDHTHRVIEHLDDLELAVARSETALRDRVLVGPTAPAQAYPVARARAESSLAAAFDSTRDNPTQHRRLRALGVALRARFSEAAATMALIDASTPALAAARLAGDRTTGSAERVHRLLTAARDDERSLLATRAARAGAAAHRVRLESAWALLVGLGVVLASFWAVRRETMLLAAAWRNARAAEASARDSEERYRLLFASSPRPTWVYDTETLRFLAVNPAAVAHYGFSESEFLAMTLADIRTDAEREEVRTWVAAAGDAPTTSQRRHTTKDGREIDVQLASHPLTFGERRARLVVVEDVTDRRRLEAKLQDLAVRDPLTGLLNRRGFEQLAAHEIACARRARRTDALLYLDLDGFKGINDTFGHAEGDDALRTVASVIADTVRDHDIVARLGGDELVVYAAGLHRSGEGHAVAARLQAALDAHNRAAAATGRAYTLAFSVGVAELAPGDTLDALLARADTALYEAKQSRYAAA
ncbi:diguanylate cyclase (plasmid) [Gemmatirosa kalamazoonensis]|uniref:Diguanylate cyclase n=1 Tax=Gemmatirosa kalamazoonensis TaxID=861299 RepID=W0RTN4_9BACT|nr:diguanylate cyclase [Gemmatirosa kalamazoonensis]AHG93812.1 diguanylate cyclase [Gemmatirosa kalamazoonensis]